MLETKTTQPELESCASKLEASENYKVLRRVARPKRAKVGVSEELRYALIVDTETTGLDLRTDEVMELGFVLVAYQEHGIQFIKDYGNEMREPERRIPAKIQELTGITNDMVRGKRISKEKITEILSLASIVIAHNASFDRPMCERLFPEFREKPWACSLNEISWDKHGFESAKLKYLLMENGHFFDGHRALDDCVALASLLSSTSPSGDTYFYELMKSARQPSFIFKVQAPYELRQEMREFGFRWHRNEGRSGGEWVKIVFFESFDLEKHRIENLKGKGVRLDYIEQDAFTRYKLRA